MLSTHETPSEPRKGRAALDADLKLKIHDLMVKARLTEEALIGLHKAGHGYFWIGGPGEEAFGVPLGLLVNKGEGPDYDYLHLHYRSSSTILAMGADPIDPLRQMRSAATDPYSGGRNFVNHYAIRKWNVVPVTSTIETQYAVAPGTAWAQRRHGGKGITIVSGGDAGTAEGDFSSCLNWSTRPGFELPILILVVHNMYGISTPATQVQSSTHLHERGTPYGIKNSAVDGNDPVASWQALTEALDYVRGERRPYLLQANVSRLHGHSSSSGAARVTDERDCISEFEAKLSEEGLLSRADADAVWERWRTYIKEAQRKVLAEPRPKGDDIFKHIYAEAGQR